MYKKTFTYTDFDGNERTEEAYFNMSKSEVIMWLTTNDGYTLDKLLEELARKNNGLRIMEIFEDLILRSYGQKSPDGRRFVKSKELSEEFKQTPMYSELFMELIDADKAVKFIEAIIPSDLAKTADELISEQKKKSALTVV